MTQNDSQTRLRIDQTPPFSRVKVVQLGSLDTEPKDLDLLGSEVITWTSMEKSSDLFAEVDVRGILTPENAVDWAIGTLWWLSGDAEVEMVTPPRYAGQPEDLIKLATPVKSPTSSGMPDGWPPLIWKSMPLYRALDSLDDALTCVENLLCALSVAPDVVDVKPWLLAGLKARYAKLLRGPYSEREYYWRFQDGPSPDRWEWL